MIDDLRRFATEMQRQLAAFDDPPWTEEEWEARTSALLHMIEVEDSALRLGDVLRLDAGLEMPIDLIRATYRRLFELGAHDVHTRLCYARYLLLHGPDWDDEAEPILREVEPIARASGLWESPVLGHHPVFYSGAN